MMIYYIADQWTPNPQENMFYKMYDISVNILSVQPKYYNLLASSKLT